MAMPPDRNQSAALTHLRIMFTWPTSAVSQATEPMASTATSIPVGRAKVPSEDGYVRSIARAPAVFRKDITSPVFRQRRRAENPRTTT